MWEQEYEPTAPGSLTPDRREWDDYLACVQEALEQWWEHAATSRLLAQLCEQP